MFKLPNNWKWKRKVCSSEKMEKNYKVWTVSTIKIKNLSRSILIGSIKMEQLRFLHLILSSVWNNFVELISSPHLIFRVTFSHH